MAQPKNVVRKPKYLSITKYKKNKKRIQNLSPTNSHARVHLRCCHITVPFATAASLNGFSTYSFPYTRKPTLLKKLQSTLDLIAFIFSHRAVVKR
jgi:hypothetical protein